jgi:large subunit ribosomal protein L6
MTSESPKAQHGLQRALLNNAVEGVTKGFEKKLEVNGVGFRVSGNQRTMSSK